MNIKKEWDRRTKQKRGEKKTKATTWEQKDLQISTWTGNFTQNIYFLKSTFNNKKMC